MNTRFLRRIAAVMVAVIAAAILAYFWRQGTPYQDRFYSPNGQFYIQKYSTGGSFRGASVGGGSDMIDGYIRIYSSDGRLIHEQFHTFIRDMNPTWSDREVFLPAENGVILIQLPQSAGQESGRTSRAVTTPTSRPVPVIPLTRTLTP